MTVNTPAGIQVSKEYQFMLPAMAQEPLKTALENCNYLIKHHRPAIVDDCPNQSYTMTRTATYAVPITPSADALRYTFETRWRCSSATQSVTVTVDYTTSYVAGGGTTWVNIFSQATVSAGAGTITVQTKADQAIPATAVALRYQITAPGAGDRDDQHLLVYPTPADTTTGVATSGAVPFDDGLMTSVDLAAIHTEWINRCKTTAVAVLQDRKQRAYSFLDEEGNAGFGRSSAEDWYSLPPVRVYLPHQSPTVKLQFYVLSLVNAGATADLIRISQLGGTQVKAAATDTIQNVELTVTTKGSGAMTHADIRVEVKTTAGNNNTLSSVCAYYTPGE